MLKPGLVAHCLFLMPADPVVELSALMPTDAVVELSALSLALWLPVWHHASYHDDKELNCRAVSPTPIKHFPL